jgi:hypothetical protein
MPTPYRAGARALCGPGPRILTSSIAPFHSKPDPGYTVVLRAGSSAFFLPEEGWEHYFSLPGLALGTVHTRAFTRWVTEGSISIPGELEKTVLQPSLAFFAVVYVSWLARACSLRSLTCPTRAARSTGITERQRAYRSSKSAHPEAAAVRPASAHRTAARCASSSRDSA